ncbi:MAG: hypothetical protein LCH46_02350 [Proteobacteria bacterium]|nr:hypothetical protein [Pseudomonadota bacterium]
MSLKETPPKLRRKKKLHLTIPTILNYVLDEEIEGIETKREASEFFLIDTMRHNPWFVSIASGFVVFIFTYPFI